MISAAVDGLSLHRPVFVLWHGGSATTFGRWRGRPQKLREGGRKRQRERGARWQSSTRKGWMRWTGFGLRARRSTRIASLLGMATASVPPARPPGAAALCRMGTAASPFAPLTEVDYMLWGLLGSRITSFTARFPQKGWEGHKLDGRTEFKPTGSKTDRDKPAWRHVGWIRDQQNRKQCGDGEGLDACVDGGRATGSKVGTRGL